MRKALTDRHKSLVEAALLAASLPEINQALRDRDELPTGRSELMALFYLVTRGQVVEIHD